MSDRQGLPTEELSLGSEGAEVRKLYSYLKHFGYFPNDDPAQAARGVAPLGADLEDPERFDKTLEDAVRQFQQMHGLKVDGVVGPKTLALIATPRCGVPDPVHGAGVADFLAQGSRWTNVNLNYHFDNTGADLSAANVRTALRGAFDRWSAVSPLRFTEVGGASDMQISWQSGNHGDGASNAFDGPGTILAHCYYPPPGGGSFAGDLHFDEAETWSVNTPPSGIDLATVALHEIGHGLGLNHSSVTTSVMYAFYGGPRRELTDDDIAGIRSIYPVQGFPDWQLLDNNPATVAIAVGGSGQLYQRHNNGRIWRYTGTPLTGWQLIDNNPATVAIVAAGNELYQRHNNGLIWRYNGTPMTGWDLLDNNPATVEIVAGSSGQLYQRHNNGRIWRYTGTPLTGWQLIDNNPATVAIVAGGNQLYQKHGNGLIWRYNGTPMTGWDLLDNNPATVEIVAASTGQLYQRHNSGLIWRFNGTPLTGWDLLDNNPATASIAAGSGQLYQRHGNGRVWKYTGTPLTGWQQLDNNPATASIAAGGDGKLYQRHTNGLIWRYTGPV